MLSTLLAGVLVLQVHLAPALVPDSVIESPGLPRMVLLGSPTPGITAIRVSLPYSAEFVTSAEVAVGVAQGRLAESTSFIGASVAVTRTPNSVALVVAGADEDLEFMQSMLQRAVASPSSTEISAARRAVEDAHTQLSETGLGYLHNAAAPKCEGVPAATPNPTSGDPDIPTVVIASELPAGALVAALRGLEPNLVQGLTRDRSPEASAESPAAQPGGTATDDPPNTLRTWLGVWWTISAPKDPALPVLMRLARQSDETGGPDPTQNGIALIESRCATAVLAWEAAYPRQSAGQVDRVAARLDEMAGGLTEALVNTAVQQTVLSLRQAASTPTGLVEQVGAHLERTGQPTAAATWFDEVAGLDAVHIRRLLTTLQAAGSRRAESR